MLARGTQISYVPTHAKGNTSHRDVEHGFVTSVRGDVAFCRYWSKSSPNELRTKSGSEATPIEMLVIQDTRPQTAVDRMLESCG